MSGPSPSPEPTFGATSGASGSQGEHAVEAHTFGDVRQSTGRFRKIMGRLQPTKSGTEGRKGETAEFGTSRTRELTNRRSSGALQRFHVLVRAACQVAARAVRLCKHLSYVRLVA